MILYLPLVSVLKVDVAQAENVIFKAQSRGPPSGEVSGAGNSISANGQNTGVFHFLL